MGQNKLQRFKELSSYPNVLQYPNDIKHRWGIFFGNTHPIILELACGKGEYTLGLARIYTDKNFIGVDLKGNRIWVGARTAIKESLKNVAFLRTEIEIINNYFEKEEVDEIWITFPDPQLRTGKAKKRLTHPKFLRLYHQFLKPGGYIHLKTDSPVLYQFSLWVIEKYNCRVHISSDDLYSNDDISAELRIQTHYEKLDIAESRKIFYLKFSLPAQLPSVELDEEFHEFLKRSEKH